MAEIKKTGPWGKTISGLNRFSSLTRKTNQQIIKSNALIYVKIVKKNIQEQGKLIGKAFKPLEESTKSRKKSSKRLIDNGDLLGSIQAKQLNSNTFFAGVMKKHPSGENIAAVHEYGTNRAGRNNDVEIPATGFIGDVAKSKKLENELQKNTEKLYKNMLKDLFGTNV